jgi:hypothetical protein
MIALAGLRLVKIKQSKAISKATTDPLVTPLRNKRRLSAYDPKQWYGLLLPKRHPGAKLVSDTDQ